MTDFYSTMPPPPVSEGNYPDRFTFDNPGQSVEGTLVDLRMADSGKYDPCPIMDIQTAQVGPDGQPVRWSVFCNPWSLWRQLDTLKPAVGSLVRVTFTGYDGRSKIFQLDVAPGASNTAVPVTAPVQAPVAQPQGFGAPAAPAQPWAQSAPVAQPQPTAAPPWGQ